MDDFFFKSLIMQITNGLLSGQTDDHRFMDQPGRKKEVVLADVAFAYGKEKGLTMSEFNFIRDSLKEIKTDIKEIRADVNTLMSFRWKIVGGSVATSFILTVIINLVAFFIKH